jgi:hypothetical protein
MPSGPEHSADVRISIAAAGVLVLAGLVAFLVLGNAPASKPAVAAPAACVDLWNSNRGARISGYHNFHDHRYRTAEVLKLDAAGNRERNGSCAVVFPARVPDPERGARAKIYRDGEWMALSRTGRTTDARLSELQVEGVDLANVALRPDGTLKTG